MKKLHFIPLAFILLLVWPNCMLHAQATGASINNTGSPPDPSAMLDVSASNKGFLLPRLNTSQMNAISAPATGLLIYNTDCNVLDYWNGGGWVSTGNVGTLSTPGSISGNSAPCPGATGVNYSIAVVTGATSYNWTVPSGAAITGGQGTDSITVNFGSIPGNVCVTASNACGTSNTNCAAITFDTTVSSPVAAPATPSSSQIVWNWNTVAGVVGYKYNTANNYASATDNGTGTSYTQTGLSCGTNYTLYVWAYNVCGYPSVATVLTQSTSACCVDGAGGAVSHYTDGNNVEWTVHTFTSSGTFTPGCAGNIGVLVVAGGGGGGSGGGGGGGAGGYIYNASYAVSASPYSVTIGGGGTGGTGYTSGSNGGNSVFDALTAIGGGGGGSSNVGNGSSGGSGGGGAQGSSTTGGSGTAGQGNAGGDGTNYASPYSAAGGGGAGAAGQNTQSAAVAGSGGNGLSNSISGSAVTYAGGGGGAVWSGDGTGWGAGGSGGGGNGCSGGGCTGAPGTPNTGGGGGGGGGLGSGVAGQGGSGIVIISYPTPQ